VYRASLKLLFVVWIFFPFEVRVRLSVILPDDRAAHFAVVARLCTSLANPSGVSFYPQAGLDFHAPRQVGIWWQ
jgi:hypothetical protein